MTPKELHDACVEAAYECPQERRFLDWDFDDDSISIQGNQYKTLSDVARYWIDCDILWKKGYSECLSIEVLDFFNAIRKAEQQALSLVCSEYGDDNG